MKRQDGFVSLLTCIMISLLLLIVTVSTVSLETMQLRKAEDAEQSARAYYTAEAGVEDAVSKVLSAHGNLADQPCLTATSTDTRNVGYDGSGLVGWTCQAIALNGKPEGKVDADKAVTIDAGAFKYDKVLVEWDKWDATTPVAPAKYNVNMPLNVGITGANYQATYEAPMMELSIAQYPYGPFSAGDANLKLKNALLVPSGNLVVGSASFAGLPGANPVRGNCVPKRATGYNGMATKYNCYALITGLGSSAGPAGPGAYDYLFRVRSRYLPATYKMTFFDGATPVDVHTGMAKIDVTAKAGDAYRRVIANLMLPEGAAPSLNYVIYSDGNVCKNFEILAETPPPGC